MVQNWLRSPDLQLLKAVNEFPGKFITYHHSQVSQSTFDDEELEAWGSEAKRWARVLFLIVDSTEHFGQILKVYIYMYENVFACFIVYEIQPHVFIYPLMLWLMYDESHLTWREKLKQQVFCPK